MDDIGSVSFFSLYFIIRTYYLGSYIEIFP